MTTPRTASAEPGRAKDRRVEGARKALAESRAADEFTEERSAAWWVGRLEMAVEHLLEVVDERVAKIEVERSKS